jgi:F0F1-type ATP synthase membrane subunit b/b'
LYTVTVTAAGGGGLRVDFSAVSGLGRMPAGTAEATEEPEEGPSPIAPEAKELLWGAGAFLVLLAAMRLWLVPKVKGGMTARRAMIRETHARADALREEARGELADYERALAAVRAEGAARVEAASRELEAERAERLAAVNAEIAERRAAAVAANDAAKEAARPTVADAVVDVAARTVELSIGHRPDGDTVRRVAGDVIGAGVGR